MKKLLVLLSLVMTFGLAASATTYSFTFRDASGVPLCDGLVLNLYKSGLGSKTLVDGYHFNTNCNSATATGVNGFKAAVHTAYQYNATGSTMIVGDPVFGDGKFGGQGVLWLVNPTYRTWILYFSGFGSGETVGGFGTWINGLSPERKGRVAATQR